MEERGRMIGQIERLVVIKKQEVSFERVEVGR